MSIDHNYARGKLKLLLRDLPNYNAGEFWREMSRIASGATASIHAEGLKAERDALSDSNTQLMQQNEAQIRMNAKLMHERDALAAHMEIQSGILSRMVEAMRNYEMDVDTDYPPPRDHRAMMADAESALEANPWASLAHRDLIKMANWLLARAADKRKQAEGLQ